MPVTIPTPRITLGKRKERSQMFEIPTEDGRIEELELPVGRGCATHENSQQAWILDADNQYFDEEDGTWHQIADERSCLPIQSITTHQEVDTDEELTSLVNQIFHIGVESAKLEEYLKVGKGQFVDKLTWIVAIGVTGLVIIAGMRWFIS